jgi:hypothetical protein
MSGIHHPDAPGKIEQCIAIYIVYNAILRIGDDDLGGFGETGGHGIFAALEDGEAFRAGDGCEEMDHLYYILSEIQKYKKDF